MSRNGPDTVGRDADDVAIVVDGETLRVRGGTSLAAALMGAGRLMLRRSPRSQKPRGAFCYMAACQECRLTVGGRRVLACIEPVREGMTVNLGRAQ
jgi:predicted molibdopterin-dependent oxidoreductase YjgC